MRKSKREITDFHEILDIIQNMDTIRIGIHDGKYPYVVPVSFGYDSAGGRLAFYFHGAKEGKKAGLLAKNPHVCVEGDICYRFKDTESSVTCLYESIIAYGKCSLAEGDEALHGLGRILSHCGYGGHTVNKNALPVTAVYKVAVESITGKCRDKHN
ncbi:MAG: 5-nitroimidazole antibiotic resistance protein [Lachnospiraceae bacterium]|nr:5-nitroimidazole antibiotic resistance protein [Lachnospiraceae bacterium]